MSGPQRRGRPLTARIPVDRTQGIPWWAWLLLTLAIGVAGAGRTTLGGTAPPAGEAESTITSGELREDRGRDRSLR